MDDECVCTMDMFYGGGPKGDSLWHIPMFVCTYSFVGRPDGGLVARPVREDAGVHTRYPRSWMDTHSIRS